MAKETLTYKFLYWFVSWWFCNIITGFWHDAYYESPVVLFDGLFAYEIDVI
jgi:hypothetical protein